MRDKAKVLLNHFKCFPPPSHPLLVTPKLLLMEWHVAYLKQYQQHYHSFYRECRPALFNQHVLQDTNPPLCGPIHKSKSDTAISVIPKSE
ncbi:hypothetical protein CEXT_302191 [Caerostris extrusa]|uniref:Uncharacterized protein n=1 Tax=Caerostris extrusa TaxID=172846 RepID=A0AAV4M5L1_CAEEX|nr:hypothetical protein CEXT_302191 [Caerostris extrusa]